MMNIYEMLNYPDYSKNFLNLEIEYDKYFILVTGYVEITKESFYIPYDGNLISGGYTETEVTSIQLDIYEIEIYDFDGNMINDPMLEKEIILEIKNQTNY